MEKQNKTTDLKSYMKEYRQSKNKVCETCGGKFNQYSQEKHNQSKKHLKQMAKEVTPVVFDKELNIDEINKYLEERFLTTAKEGASENNKVKRVNSNLTLWKKLASVAESLKYQWLLKNRLELVKLAYKTPSSQQVALSALKIVLDHIHPLGDLKKDFYEEGKLLSKKYIEEAVLNPAGMSYEDLAKYENDENPVVALFAHLYAPDMPALRLGDWLNSTVHKNKLMNEILLSKGIMRRRISKVMPDVPEEIKLSKSLVKYIKMLEIKGPLFGTLSLQDVVNIISRSLGEGNGPRYWRRKYVSEIVSKMSGKERVKVAAEMNHSVETAVVIYDRQKSTQTENVKIRVKNKK